MNLLINILLLLLGFIGATAAIGGDTWLKKEAPLYRRITVRGWLAIGCLSATLGLGVVKEVRTTDANEQSAQEAEDLLKQLGNTRAQLNESQHLLQNLLRATNPTDQVRKLITDGIVELANKKGYSNVHLMTYENTSIQAYTTFERTAVSEWVMLCYEGKT